MRRNNLLTALGFVVICLVAGAIGSVFTMPAIPTWYASLQKPWFTPPNWIFGPVWTILYVLMGIAAYLVYQTYEISQNNKQSNGRAGGSNHKLAAKSALSLFAVQLALNLLWSLIFFGLHAPFYALFCIIFLWVSILVTLVAFYRISQTAGLLLAPYLIWVSFASLLNFYVWLLN